MLTSSFNTTTCTSTGTLYTLATPVRSAALMPRFSSRMESNQLVSSTSTTILLPGTISISLVRSNSPYTPAGSLTSKSSCARDHSSNQSNHLTDLLRLLYPQERSAWRVLPELSTLHTARDQLFKSSYTRKT